MPAVRKTELVVVAVLALASIAAMLVLPRAGPPGLAGSYWNNPDWGGSPAVSVSGASPSSADLNRRLRTFAPGAVSAAWTGFLIVERAGPYQFVLRSAGQAHVAIGGVTVVSTDGGPGSRAALGSVTLEVGAQPIEVRYAGTVFPHDLSLLWMRDGGQAEVVTAGVLTTARPPASRIRHGRAIRIAAVAIPAMWAALLLYVPVRLAGGWMWAQVRHATPDRQGRLALVAVLVLAAGLTLWGVDWSIRGDDWAPDELRPNVVRDALAQRFAGGWYDKYPAMHYLVLGLPLSAFELAERVPSLTADPFESFVAQFVIVRLVSVVMGLGALLALYLCATELSGPRRAVLAPLVLALTPLYVFYGKLANLDLPTLCWFGWTLVAFVRIMRGGALRDYVLLGTAAAASVATKDQAYASLALLPPAVFWATMARQSATSWWRRALAAAFDRRLVAGLAATVIASLVFHNVIVNPTGFKEHLRLLSEFNDIAIVPRTVAGAAELTWRSLDLFRMSLGVPSFILAISGIAAAVRRPDRRWWLWLLLVPLSFHLTFTCVTFFVCDRYLLSGIFVLALFAGASLGDLMDAVTWRKAAWSGAAAALVISLANAASINVMMDLDARNAARTFVMERTRRDEMVGMVGRYTPYVVPPLRVAVLDSPGDLTAVNPDFVIVNARYAARFDRMRSPDGRNLMRVLRDPSSGYREVFGYRAPLPFWALLQYEPSFRIGREAWWTNLDKVNPEVLVFARHDH